MALQRVLQRVRGKVAISGYHGPLMDRLYGNWHVYEAATKLTHCVKTPRTEVLWTNYPIAEAQVQEAILQHE